MDIAARDSSEWLRVLLGRDAHVRVLGRGCDHTAYDVDGALVARVRHDGDAAAVETEAAVLRLVADVSPIPTPEVVAVDASAGLLVVRRLPGTSLLDEPPSRTAALAEQLAALLNALLEVPLGDVDARVPTDDEPASAYLAEAAGLFARIRALLGPDEQTLVERFLGAPPPSDGDLLCFCHNDLGAEHLLAGADRSVLTGVIDWSDSAIADPAHDLGRLHRDLGPSVARQVLELLSLPDASAVATRAAFFARGALIEDLAYGAATGDVRYVAAAREHLSRTFAADG